MAHFHTILLLISHFVRSHYVISWLKWSRIQIVEGNVEWIFFITQKRSFSDHFPNSMPNVLKMDMITTSFYKSHFYTQNSKIKSFYFITHTWSTGRNFQPIIKNQDDYRFLCLAALNFLYLVYPCGNGQMKSILYVAYDWLCTKRGGKSKENYML